MSYKGKSLVTRREVADNYQRRSIHQRGEQGLGESMLRKVGEGSSLKRDISSLTGTTDSCFSETKKMLKEVMSVYVHVPLKFDGEN